ncbi:hypothetical protein [Ahrensia sp. R2A130]|uniref:hypothetical protein n=1 Tax=Ahrensia sp. R2A130 TaxID=744979 RepID=UPI0012E9C479|nr:hypothetical protein [Ahrensia sp. R2A130]
MASHKARIVRPLSNVSRDEWRIKRYAILADGRTYDDEIAEAATKEAIRRLPLAGNLNDVDRNHGIAIQLIHFAETAVVSPVFYWKWGMVLGHIDQMRAQWREPTNFQTGVREVVGCIWEMDIISFEIKAWKERVLNKSGSIDDLVTDYLNHSQVA